MHWVGGALLDPKTVRTERLWFVRYMATIIGHFTMAMAHQSVEEQNANAPWLRCATIFRTCTGAKFSTKFSTAAVYQYTIVLVCILVVLVVHVPNIKMDYSSHGKFIILECEYRILYFSTVRLFINQWSFWVAHCHQKCVRTEISGSAFFST